MAIASASDLADQFVDDTLASILRSAGAGDLLRRQVPQLFANDRALLLRVIRILRVACVRAPNWVGGARMPSLFNVPDGTAWEAALVVINDSFDEFSSAEYLVLIGLLEDWCRGVSWGFSISSR